MMKETTRQRKIDEKKLSLQIALKSSHWEFEFDKRRFTLICGEHHPIGHIELFDSAFDFFDNFTIIESALTGKFKYESEALMTEKTIANFLAMESIHFYWITEEKHHV